MMPWMQALAGGMLLGLSAMVLLIGNGRIAGISGIFGRMLDGSQVAANAAFLLGLLAGPPVFAALAGHPPAVVVQAGWPAVLAAGLLVGVGTRMGGGCTSGHGILGLARFSKRSMVATGVFMATGFATATLMGVLR